ncbi:MAG: phosphotransferase family protein [Halioglobus sp.]|nr:phosphotransferase family protein [Halioglobus sp.]
MSGAIERNLETVLAREVPGFRSLISCVQLTSGASQETFCVTLATTAGERQLALRRAPPGAESAASAGGISAATEAELVQLAGEHGVPAPAVIYILQPRDDLGEGFVMQWLEGETLGQRIASGDELASVRPRLARQCGEILGRIHSIDWQGKGLGELLPVVEPAALVEETWARYRDLDVPLPMIDYCWRWLLRNLPGSERLTLVHGDFRNGNLMVTPAGINAVLDWELAHIGDPIRDLGWLCVNSWRFGANELPVGGFGSVEELLAGYHSTSGVSVPRREITFWQVFGSFWWATATLQMAAAWRRGETPSLERPVIGRRSSEAQMDCVNLLIPGETSLPDNGSAAATGTQLPMPEELLAGVRTFLKETVASQLHAQDGFLARVAANSLGIAQREFRYGPELARRETDRLASLLGRQGNLDTLRRELVEQLRNGMPLDTAGLDTHLRQTVAGQLFIDQPRYPALQGPS